jgi:UDP-glucuronate 4-epimerase
MNILITGCAGFIGFHLAKKFLNNHKIKIYGIDNLNKYYDTKLKNKRLSILKRYKNFTFYKLDLNSKKKLINCLGKIKIDIVYHLAAQAGVRYSLKNPDSYIYSNIVGFYNLIETIKEKKIKKFFYASSSSVYSEKNKTSYHEERSLLEPGSLYALTKITNENFAKFYSQNLNFNFIGLRFFTVYGPLGRPDMAYSIFTDSIKKKKVIKLFNKGENLRDMTYIDDVINILIKLKSKKYKSNHEIFNIGRENPVTNFELLKLIEENLMIKAKFIFTRRNKIEVLKTYSNSKKIIKFTNFNNFTDIKDGIRKYLNSLSYFSF